MNRKLKIALAAAMALGALGALGAVGAQAAGENFHCTIAAECRLRVNKDGTGTTAHQVFVVTDGVNSASFTCVELTGEARFASPTSSITLENIHYDTCNVVGEPVEVRMNECSYVFGAEGGGTDEAAVNVECKGAKHIEVEIKTTGCVLTITPQPLSGVGYHNTGSGATREVTVTSNVPNIAVEPIAGDTVEECFINPSKTLTGHITTGNAIATGETESGEMKEAWWE